MTLRLRLTLLYTLVFLAAGIALVVISFALLDHSLPSNSSSALTTQDIVARASKLAQDGTALSGKRQAKLTDEQRSELKSLDSLPSDEVVRVVQSLPSFISKPLLSSLPSDVSAHTRSTFLRESLLALACASVIAFVLGWYVAGRALRPLHTITATARDLSHDDLSRRINLVGPDDELKRLADTFDEMLARLDAAFAGQRRFVADASHELRTPLTIMRTEIDVTLRHPDPSRERLTEMARVVRDAVDRSERLVASLLALASSEHGLDEIEAVDFASAARDAIARATPLAAARHVAVTATIPDDALLVDGDPALIDRLLDNLLDNAVRHNVDGGRLDVHVAADDDTATLDVTNTGAVIDPATIATLLTPFRRATNGRADGFGLGLAIVRSIAAAHGGNVALAPNTPGGLTVTVTLPMQQRQPSPTPVAS
jgi:signal transduction histidine kinase